MNNYSQVTPVTGVDQVGLIYDRPAAALPPNAFSDALNVRFRDGTVRKMEGEVNIFPNLFDDSNTQIGGVDVNYDGSLLKYAFFWPNPNLIGGNSGYYVVITEESRLVADDTIPPPGNSDPVQQRDVAYLVSVDGINKVQKGVFSVSTDAQWQHTFFQGGFAVIINNSVDKPQYILDNDINSTINTVPNFSGLPGWESYEVNQQFLEDAFDPNNDSYIFDLGQKIDFDNTVIVVERINSTAPTTVVTLTANGDTGADGTPNNPSFVAPVITSIVYSPWIVPDEYQIFYDPATETTVLNLPSNLSESAIDTVTVTVRSRNPVTVRAGVVRSFGDFLVAGDLIERDETDNNIVIRSLPGVIRTSDVAKPGNVPNNWNPFAAGVSTADEFVVSDTSAVTDMAEMQGNFYIYTPNSIKVLRLTGNANVPLAISPVAESLGCQTLHGLVEFDGKHFVVGSKDIYLFTGNPGSSESISNDRIRRHLFNNLNPVYADNLFVLNNKQQDEVWICYPTKLSTSGNCDEALIWSYRNNTWTRRELPNVVAGVVGLIPGGGLPSTRITVTGTSGSNGVAHVGANEVRMMGTDSTVSYTSSDLMYTGDATGEVYGTGRLGYLVRLVDGGTGERPMYATSTIAPEVTLTGPDGVNVTFPLPTPVDDDVTEVTAQDIWDAIDTQLEALSGWSTSTLPTGYTQETGTVSLIATVTEGGFLGLRDVADIPFSLSLNTNTLVSNVTYPGLNFEESTVNATVQGVTVDGAVNDYRGSFVKRATPTIIGIRVVSPLKTGGEEMIFMSAGTALDYDPVTHTGSTNGTTLSDSTAVTSWINTIRINSTDLVATAGVSDNQFILQPSTFSGDSDLVVEVRVNDTAENGQWIWDKYQETVAGTISLANYSVDVSTLANPVNFDEPELATIEQASTAPAIAGSLDTQFTQDPTRRPDRTYRVVAADMSVSTINESYFSVDRPWSANEINPNLEFPILCSRKQISGPSTELVYMNKILAADIGWSTPSYDFNPRTETSSDELFTRVITNNDAPLPYTSYVERKEFSITPDMDTESIHEVAMWASGNYVPFINSDPIFNRLQLRMKGTDNPGRIVDLTSVGNGVTKNTYFISESYKMDTRVHGRFLSFRITDEILDASNIEQDTTSNTKKTTSTTFSKKSAWEFASLQPEVNKGGRR